MKILSRVENLRNTATGLHGTKISRRTPSSIHLLSTTAKVSLLVFKRGREKNDEEDCTFIKHNMPSGAGRVAGTTSVESEVSCLTKTEAIRSQIVDNVMI